MRTSLQLMFFFWQVGFVDTFTLLQFCANTGSQYGAIVLASAAGNFSTIGPKIFLEPIIGLGTGYQYIRAARTMAERRIRIATLAAFLSTSLPADPATNGAVGGAVASKINYMRAILARGGGGPEKISYKLTYSLKDFGIIVDSVKAPLFKIHPYRAEFTGNCKVIIDNVFHEHTVRRCFQGSSKTIPKTIIPVAAISSNQINIAFIGWTFFGVGIIGFSTLGALYLFQRVERYRYQNKNDEVLIDIRSNSLS